MKERKERIARRVFLGLALLGLFAVPVWTALGPRSGVSYWEQRALAPIPEVSAERIWSGEFFADAETFLSDHIAWREPILKANTALDLGLGRPKVNDQVVSADKLLAAYGFSRWGLDYLGPQAEEAAEHYRTLNEKITGYGGYFCYLGLPLQSSYFASHYPPYLESRLWHTSAIREAFAAAMAEEGVPFLGMYDLYADQGLPEEYYYATDHHYTIRGALRAAQAAVERINADIGLGLPELRAEDYDWERLPNPFLGSSNRKLYGLWENDDAVEVPRLKESIPFTRKDRGEAVEAALFTLPETAGEDVTYSVYMGGDIAETVIDTGRKELPSLLLYGDSFTNPLECLLWRDFNVTYCVDFRYETEKTLDDYLAEYRPDVVLCVRDETTFLSADGNGTTGGET